MTSIIVPQFPSPKQGEEGILFPKYLLPALEYFYDILVKVSCDVAPKRSSEKIPVGNWETATYTRKQALEVQKRDNVSGWCVRTGYGRVFVIDLDKQAISGGGHNPQDVYNELQTLSPTGFVLRSPSNGVHMYYRVPDGLDMLSNANTPNITGVDVRGDGGQVVSLGGFNRYEG